MTVAESLSGKFFVVEQARSIGLDGSATGASVATVCRIWKHVTDLLVNTVNLTGLDLLQKIEAQDNSWQVHLKSSNRFMYCSHGQSCAETEKHKSAMMSNKRA